MSIHDSKPGDIYADKNGKLWRVVGIWSDPTVRVEEVEPTHHPDGPEPAIPYGEKRAMFGGVGGCMWSGFTRIYRVAPPTKGEP